MLQQFSIENRKTLNQSNYPKALTERGNMLQETFAVDTYFPNQMFRRFATREYVSAVKQRHILLLETMLPVWHNWEFETLGKHMSAANVSGNHVA